MKKILSKLFSRNFIIIAIMILQIVFMGFAVWKLRENYCIKHKSA